MSPIPTVLFDISGPILHFARMSWLELCKYPYQPETHSISISVRVTHSIKGSSQCYQFHGYRLDYPYPYGCRISCLSASLWMLGVVLAASHCRIGCPSLQWMLDWLMAVRHHYGYRIGCLLSLWGCRIDCLSPQWMPPRSIRCVGVRSHGRHPCLIRSHAGRAATGQHGPGALTDRGRLTSALRGTRHSVTAAADTARRGQEAQRTEVTEPDTMASGGLPPLSQSPPLLLPLSLLSLLLLQLITGETIALWEIAPAVRQN